MSHKIGNIKTATPKFRYGLKAEIVKAGHRTLSDFAQRAKINLPRLSRIVSGWELPGPGLQRKMAECLGITITELRELLK